MKFLRRIVRAFIRRREPHDTPPVIDHIHDTGASGDWRKRKLLEAAEKYGKPFKCGGDDVPHETLVRGDVVTTNERLR